MKPLGKPMLPMPERVVARPGAKTAGTPLTSSLPEVKSVSTELPTKAVETARKKTTGDVGCASAEALAPLGPITPPTSTEGFAQLLDELWARKADLALQPKHTMVYRLSGLEVPECSPIESKPYFKQLAGIVGDLPPFVEAGAKGLGATRVDVAKGLAAAADGTLDQTAFARLEWGTFRFHAKSFDPTAAQSRVFLNTKPEAALKWTKWLVDEVLSQPKKFPGVDVVELAGPASTTRADDVMILVSDDEGRKKLLEWIAAKADKNPELLENATIPGAHGVRAGVSWGNEPDLTRYPGESFRSVRARVLFNALIDTVESGGDRKALTTRATALMKEAGLDASQPHLNAAVTAASAAPVNEIPGAVVPKAGTYECTVDAWGSPVKVKIELTEKVAAAMARQKNMVFIPSQGTIAFTEMDNTRDPPQRVIKNAFSLTHSADQRYKIENGEEGPRLLAYDEKSRAFYVPDTVRLVPSTKNRLFSAEPVGEASSARKATEPLHVLVRRFVEPQRGAEEVATAAARIEKYLSDPDVKVVASIPLEEGVNGKAIVKLSNGAVAMWKPSNAEYPDVMRSNLDPDHFARREAFAYEISKAMGHLGRVPPAVYRDLEGQPGALIALVRSSEAGVFSNALDGLMSSPPSDNYRQIALLDHVLGALDRHHGNVLFTSGNCLAIDHGLCLPRRHGDQGAHQFMFDQTFALSPAEKAQLDKIAASASSIREAGLALGIHAEALDLMFERVDKFRADGAVSSYWRQGA